MLRPGKVQAREPEQPSSGWPNRLRWGADRGGVETTDQAQALRRTGCRYAQGYLFSPPVPSGALVDLLPSHPA